jgi:hypothetical protein
VLVPAPARPSTSGNPPDATDELDPFVAYFWAVGPKPDLQVSQVTNMAKHPARASRPWASRILSLTKYDAETDRNAVTTDSPRLCLSRPGAGAKALLC